MARKWTEEECDTAIREVADMARAFHPEGYLNLHAISQVCFELVCQRNALKEVCEEIANHLYQDIDKGRCRDMARAVLEKCK